MKNLSKAILTFSFIISSTIGFSQKWDQAFPTSSGTGGYDMVEFDGDFYVAGAWSTSLETYIAKWDGTEWTAVGAGFVENTNSLFRINALEVFDGDLYIGGRFQLDIDGSSYYGFAKWNGTAWEAVTDFPINSSNNVTDLDLFNGNIMLGGNFSGQFGGGTTIRNVIGHNGTNWVPFDEGVYDGDVLTMEEHNGEFYIAGKFVRDGATAGFLDNFAKWDGSNQEWVNVGAFASLYTNSGYIDQIQSYGSHLYVYTIRDDIFNNFPQLLRWDVTSEITNINTVSVSPEYSRMAQLSDMTVFDGNLVVAGNFVNAQSGGNASPIQIESYDGTTWNKALPGGTSASVLGIFESKLTNGSRVMNDPSANILSDKTVACEGEDVTYSYEAVSTNTITSVSWTFEGGTPGTSTEDSPVINYSTGGTFDVTLEVTSSDGTNQILKQDVVTVNNDLSITTQPVNVTICDSENANFFVVGTGDGVDITYQWQMDDGSGFVDLEDGEIEGGSSVSGSTSSSVTISRNGLSQNELNGNTFRCVVSKCSSINSGEVTLTVNEAPIITEEPISAAICESGDAAFSVTATSDDDITYQWQYRVAGTNTYMNLTDAGVYSGTSTASLDISGADDTLMELFETDDSDGVVGAVFRCLVNASGCEVTSTATSLFIHVPPTVSTDPEDVEVCNTGAGASATFSVTSSISVSGFPYQWQVDDGSGFVDIEDDDIYSGANTKDLSLTGAPSEYDGYQYRCEIGGCSTPVISSTATLTIHDNPVIVTQPVTRNVCVGVDTEFVVEATGDNLTYLWRVDSGSGYEDLVNDDNFFASDGTLQISSPTESLNNYRFRCMVSSGTCSVSSSAPTLRVYGEPSITGGPDDKNVCEGQATFFRETVSSFNSQAHSYQWQEALPSLPDIFVDISDGDKYTGTNTTRLDILNTTISMDGNLYRLVAKGCLNEIASESAVLTINQLPIVIESPVSQTVCTGEEVTFTADATGTDVQYSWLRDTGSGYSTITGFSTNPDLTVFALSEMSGYKYKCQVISALPCNPNEPAESAEAVLIVNKVEITTHPVETTICAGGDVIFSIEAEGESLTYQWFENDVAIVEEGLYSGTTTAMLLITATTEEMRGNRYHCTVGGLCEDQSSNGATLVVNFVSTPEILVGAMNGSSITLIVNISAESYEWFKDGESISTNSSIEVEEEGNYTVIVSTLGCFSEESEPYVVTPAAVLGTTNGYSMEVYPNPTSRYLKFNSNQTLTAFVFGLDGKMVIRAEVDHEKGLDLKELDAGQYMIHLLDDDKIIYKGKVIKRN